MRTVQSFRLLFQEPWLSVARRAQQGYDIGSREPIRFVRNELLARLLEFLGLPETVATSFTKLAMYAIEWALQENVEIGGFRIHTIGWAPPDLRIREPFGRPFMITETGV